MCRAGDSSCCISIATKLSVSRISASVQAGKRRGSASEVEGARGRTGGKAGLPEPSGLMGGPGPPSFSRSVILGQHVPGVASPGSYPPLNSVRQFMYIATWNVLSLQSSSSKLHELAAAVDKFRLGVLLLTETHWPGVETLSLDNGALFINSGRLDGVKREGVGIVLSKTTWTSCVLDDYRNATGRSKSIRVLTNIASDRKEWRQLTALRTRIPEAGHSND